MANRKKKTQLVTGHEKFLREQLKSAGEQRNKNTRIKMIFSCFI